MTMHRPRFDSAFYRLFFVMISIILVMQISAGLLLFKLYSTAPFKPPPGMSASLQWGAAVMIQVMPALISSWIGARMLAAPFRTLTVGAAELSRNIDAPPIKEIGPVEARQAASVFNTMQASLRRQMSERNRFLAAVSHDLRTPLTRMTLRLRSAQDVELSDRLRDDIDEMTQLLEATLSFLRNEEVVEAFSPVDINALVDAIAEDAAELGQKVTISGEVPPISAQPLGLKRCLTNLVANAIRYGEDAHIRLIDTPSCVRIQVVDHGPGIPELQLERALEPFYRVESSRNRNTGGTGLGLAIANDVVKRHGGELVLRNGSEGGLVAQVTLPRR
ncbi:two-component system sensor histidine kinase [Burkholderia aenigmatica]|uniref:histidine kinase n=1 Tax=Burkholderia aenigmatica TaxID=2015348 RepID=A0A6J5IUY3_9BURK|nr:MULTISPECIES: ATP-binding protein [Burkholderia]MCA8295354.1 two-component sensor histidine kinase [Burkholderia sp. AU30198]UKD12718.1 ATP-binding protein [Burkholderia aenigmatica]CAB3963391.1 two-component system sensor histidine kinase [Burkholderia aenigmatica]VWC58441.1 two-component system sensor histidine kinase [Burkholderia aenigmatica]